jgi:hypothetical protein
MSKTVVKMEYRNPGQNVAIYIGAVQIPKKTRSTPVIRVDNLPPFTVEFRPCKFFFKILKKLKQNA